MTLSAKTAALTGPDRAVDAEVAVALGYERDGDVFRTEREDFILERDYYSLEGGLRELPRFTASLDAAMSVAQEGAGIKLMRYWTASDDGPVWDGNIISKSCRDNLSCFKGEDGYTAASYSGLGVFKAGKAVPFKVKAGSEG